MVPLPPIARSEMETFVILDDNGAELEMTLEELMDVGMTKVGIGLGYSREIMDIWIKPQLYMEFIVPTFRNQEDVNRYYDGLVSRMLRKFFRVATTIARAAGIPSTMIPGKVARKLKRSGDAPRPDS
jgi:hypothetical protein